MPALPVGHPWRHLGHAAHVHADAAKRVLDEPPRGGNARAGLAREEEDAHAEASRIEALAPGRLGEVQRVGGRAVERARPELARPADGGQGLPRGAGAERKGRGAEPLHPRERSPRAHVQAEEGADHHAIVGSDPGAPEDTGVRFSDARPVIPADAEDRGPARGAARAVNPRDVGRLDAEVVAEWRMRGLRLA